MKKQTSHFQELETVELQEINGGAFAFDVGRVLRFIGLSAGSIVGTAYAVTDWQVNEMIN